jgi:DnaJ-class molecular chaperone
MSDPYKILGVARDASADDLKKAYRKLAKKLHPDLNPGDNTVEQRFKEVSQAYGILGDAEKRKRFDRGEINASGQETAPAGAGGFYRRYAGTGKGAKYNPFDFTAEFGAEDILSEMFGRRGGRRGTVRRRGQDVSYSLDVDFLQAIIGGKTRLQLAAGKTLDVTLAPGTEDGQTLRLKGQGMAGMGEAPSGDALITIKVKPHPYFSRSGDTIHLELPITLQEAVLGGSVQVPTVHGKVAMKIPAGSNTGGTLRLKGKGVRHGKSGKAGDQHVSLKVMLPDAPDQELKDFVESWGDGGAYDPRRKAGMS